MTTALTRDPAKTTFRAKVTGRHAITLPAELCRQLGIATGDSVEITLQGQQAMLRPAHAEPVPPLKGLLRDYFTDWDDINRFVQEERQGWEEREKNWS
jgi:bifunctional DNA-binding transcriptional regulator/antitoxin component of YhaV-PrlF toxin-antitoxin module